MAILNTTPDSFSDGGKYVDSERALDRAFQLIDDGADIIDIGGESTRPGAESVSIDVEIKRTLPLIENIRKYDKNIFLSIDTTKYEVAKYAAAAGINMINDISGLQFDVRLAEIACNYNLAYILMHIKGKPRSMQNNPFYNDILSEVYQFLNNQIEMLKKYGVKQIYTDPGIGFGKSYEHNIKILKNLAYFDNLKVPIVLGISRKSFIGKMLGIDVASERDIPTLLIHSLLLKNNVEIIRVHTPKLFKNLKKISEVLL